MCALQSGKTKLSIVIPSLNEGKNIHQTIDSLYEFTKKNFEVIVVNDCTDSYLWEDLPKRRGLKVIHNTERLGRPQSVQRGIEAARHEKFVVFNARMRFCDVDLDMVRFQALYKRAFWKLGGCLLR